MISRRIDDAEILGAAVSWTGKSPFHRAPLVLHSAGWTPQYLKVRRYVDDGAEAEGELLQKEEWDALVHQQEAMNLDCTQAVPDGWLWMFRKNFALGDEPISWLRENNRIVGEVLRNGEDRACVIREKDLLGQREAWANHAARLAEELLRKRADSALAAAETAFDLGLQMNPGRVALLALAHRLGGREQRADGYFTMAERSLGESFAAEVKKEHELLAARVSARRSLRADRRCAALEHSRQYLDDCRKAA